MANEPDAGEEPGTTEKESTDKETSDVDERKFRAEDGDQDDNGGMPRITIRMPQRRLDELEQLVERQEYPSRSEAIRAGVREVVNRERGGA